MQLTEDLGQWSTPLGQGIYHKPYSFGPLPVTSNYNPIYRMYNPIYNQL